MTILYVATDQRVPGRVGGSVHVTAVARGLAALGHDVHVVVTRGDGPFPDDGATWIDLRPPFGARRLRWALASRAPRASGTDPARRGDRALLQLRRRRGARGTGGGRADAARGERAGDRLSRFHEAADRPGAARRADAAVARLAVPACRSVRHAAGGHPAGVGPYGADRAAGVGRRYGAVHAGRNGRCAVRPSGVPDAGGFRRRVPRLARRAASGRRDAATARTWPRRRRCGADRRRTRAAAGAAGGGADRRRDVRGSGGARGDAGVPRRGRRRRGAVRRGPAPTLVARLLLVAAEAVRVHGGRGCRWWRRPSIGLPNLWGTGRRACCTMRTIPLRWPARSRGFCDPALRRRLGAAARARAVRDYGWDRHCERLAAAIEAAREHRRPA